MNFGYIELDPETQAFMAEVGCFCDEYVTDALLDEEFRTGSGFDERMHKAMGARGWVLPTWPVELGGAGATTLQSALLVRELAARGARTVTLMTTRQILPAVVQWGSDELKSEVLAGIAGGDVRLCMGYTEPDCGSDIAAARTRAVADGEDWIIDGQKMFTTGAQNCQYSFLLTRTDPDAPKHQGLTMFLCPLEQAEIRAVETLSGERTNMVFYDSVRVPDRYRLGPVNGGWNVLLGPLNEEHAVTKDETVLPLERPGGMYGLTGSVSLKVAVDWARTPNAAGQIPVDDPLVRVRLARAALEVEIGSSSDGPAGRVISSEMSIRVNEDLLNLVGPAGLLVRGEDGAVGNGWLEYAHRFAQGTAIYGGTTDVFRNMIAERELGLPRSSRPARKVDHP
jgi:3-oxocholest-4-en-26-oyl-CoA dehydrogenase alpha subunit